MDQYEYIFGRPREHNRQALAKKLIEWAQLETSVNLNGFCAENMLPAQRLTEFAKAEPYFHEAYTYAKTCLAKRREEKLSEGTLHTKAYDINASVYDHFLKQERMDMIEFEAKSKAPKDCAQDNVGSKFDVYDDQLTSKRMREQDNE